MNKWIGMGRLTKDPVGGENYKRFTLAVDRGYKKDGKKIYTTDVRVDEIEFCESKKKEDTPPTADEYIQVPEGIENDLPWK